jgi:membrane protein required for beta-lactamase induction
MVEATEASQIRRLTHARAALGPDAGLSQIRVLARVSNRSQAYKRFADEFRRGDK